MSITLWDRTLQASAILIFVTGGIYLVHPESLIVFFAACFGAIMALILIGGAEAVHQMEQKVRGH